MCKIINTLIEDLGLSPHPEGGYYRETYRSTMKIPAKDLPDTYDGDRSLATNIYFLLPAGSFSALHRIKQDETWHFYYGDPLEIHMITNKGEHEMIIMGDSSAKSTAFQYTVKGGQWFGARVKDGGRFSLVGCSVYPGFDFQDFEMGRRSELISDFPQLSNLIESLTRE